MSSVSASKVTPKTGPKKVLRKKSAVEETPLEVEVEMKAPEEKKAVKKLPKKPVAKQAPVEESKEEELAPKKMVKKPAAKKTTKAVEEPVATKKSAPKKAVAKKSAKEPEVEAVEEEKQPKVKKINNKPTLSDTCGLNISVAKVRNIISNLCINKESFAALKEIKAARVFPDTPEELPENEEEKKALLSSLKKSYTFSLAGLSKETLEYLNKCELSLLESKRLAHSKVVVKALSEEDRKAYMTAKKEAVAQHQSEQKNAHLFQFHEFDLTAFNLRWNPNFYKDMEVDNWKNLQDMPLCAYATNLVNKVKVRFNSESKIFITAYVEHILKQMVLNGTVNCISSGKKIIKLEHALNMESEGFAERFPLFPLLTNLETYRRHLVSLDAEEVEEEEPEEDAEEKTPDRKFQFKYYVAELCRTVRIELSRADATVEDHTQSVYNQTSVSADFKKFCSSIIVDLIRMFGDVLKTEVSDRNVKTVNYGIVKTLLRLSHQFYGLSDELTNSISFIQERYVAHKQYLDTRASKRGASAGEDSDAEDEE